MTRTFTLDEARALLPRVGALVRAMQERKAAFDRHRAAEHFLARRSTEDEAHLRHAQLAHHEAAVQLVAEIEHLLAAIHELGVEVKGIDEGLIDFPTERDGRRVYLCWKLDEPDIAWWHDLTTGFRGRQPL